MRSKIIRNWAFILHRYIGLALGLLLIVICLTGGLLVFSHEVDAWIVSNQFSIIPQAEMISADTAIATARTAYPQWKIEDLTFPKDDRHPFTLRAVSPDSKDPEIYLHGIYTVYVNPYTGKVLGDRAERFTVYRFLLNLHYRLFLESTGDRITYFAAMFLIVIAITGIILCPGWRKLSTGFKIKWNAHIKRRNFDLHKVSGIIVSVFLVFTAVTGIAFTHYEQVRSIIYTLTFTKPTASESTAPELSQPPPGQLPVSFDRAIAQARKALPSLQIASIALYTSEALPFEIYSKSDEVVYVDPYTAKILKVKNPQLTQSSLGDRMIDLIFGLHFGTFGGLPTRILYMFVGLSPLILFTTGFIMWRYRRRVEGDRS